MLVSQGASPLGQRLSMPRMTCTWQAAVMSLQVYSTRKSQRHPDPWWLPSPLLLSKTLSHSLCPRLSDRTHKLQRLVIGFNFLSSSLGKPSQPCKRQTVQNCMMGNGARRSRAEPWQAPRTCYEGPRRPWRTEHAACICLQGRQKPCR